MAQSPPPTLRHRTALVRVLGDLMPTPVAESSQPFAERLGQWLDFKDGLALFAVLEGEATAAAEAPSASPPATSASLWKAFARVRDTLSASIAKVAMPAQPSANGAADFAPYRQYYLAHQRDMAANIASLRASARAALARQSPELKQLAALDAVLDKAWLTRETSLLAKVPAMLAERFEQHRNAHQTDDPARGQPPGHWLTTFCEEMRATLLAELELRLQPVQGLIAALDHEVKESLE